jgi:hypothetical protein
VREVLIRSTLFSEGTTPGEQSLNVYSWITDMILFGVMVHQAALWAQNFKVERMFIKVIIVG